MRAAGVVCRTVVASMLLVVAGAGAQAPVGQTPRQAVLEYLEAARANDWGRAADYLDMRRIPAGQREARGRLLARHLAVVLDRALVLDVEGLSDRPEGEHEEGLADTLERVGTVQGRTGKTDILLQRGDDGWKFAPATLARVPALYEEFGYGAVGELLPAFLIEHRVLDVALWQWIGLLVLVVVAYAVSWILSQTVIRALRRFGLRAAPETTERLLVLLDGPLRLGIALVVFAAGAHLLALSLAVALFFEGIEKAGAIVTVAWFLLRVVDALVERARAYLLREGQVTAIAMLPVGSKGAKVVVLVFALLAVLQNVGVNVTGILAGLGIGGLAVALAAQKTVENLFGGVTLMVDQPVRVGDFCRFGDRVGVVEDVGLRSTRVRTLDRTLVTVPNGEFAALQLENFTARDRIWFHPTIGLRYETTPDQLRWVLVEIRKMLYAHPKVDPNPARIRFVSFGAYSLDLEVFAYVQTRDFGEFLAICEDINLRIMDIVAASGTSFAFPSQTAYLATDSAPDEEKRRAAERQTQAWRESGERYLPEFPPEAIAALRGTITYPPEAGAAPPR